VLLAANVHDYPRSADAQFGLGRAYRVAGREQLAVAAFRRALQLRPSDVRARAALRQT
jgi:cytochrome c-type biogenesis protein CcmH/NrfG